MSNNNKEEPNTAPKPDQWYTLTLGNSFKDDQPSSKFCTLRYEFKPASIDKSQPGTLHKTKDNKINVEFNNNQPGKPKVTFEGSSEDYKENDAVLFFDGTTFRMERLHQAVKRLRHVRKGETGASGSASGAAAMVGNSVGEASSSPVGRGVKGQPQNVNIRPSPTPPRPLPPPSVPVEVEQIDIEVERINIGDTGSAGGKPRNEKSTSTPPTQPVATASPDSNDFDLEAIMNDDDDADAFGPAKSNSGEKPFHTGIDINVPHNDTDDEIADVDVNDDNGGMGRNAAEALRAQVNAEGREEQTSSSSASSSESSESSSESGSSSSDSESSEGDSVNSI